MADKVVQYTFLGAVKHFFGIENKDMMRELKPLTEQDRLEIKVGLIKLGYNIIESKPVAHITHEEPEKKEEPKPYSLGDPHPTQLQPV